MTACVRGFDSLIMFPQWVSGGNLIVVRRDYLPQNIVPCLHGTRFLHLDQRDASILSDRLGLVRRSLVVVIDGHDDRTGFHLFRCACNEGTSPTYPMISSRTILDQSDWGEDHGRPFPV